MLEYIRTFLTIVFAISMMYVLLDCDLKQKKRKYYLLLFAVAVMICDMLVIMNFGYTFFMGLFPLFVHLPVVIFFVLVSRFSLIKVLFVHFTLVAISNSLSLVGFFISYFLNHDQSIVSLVNYFLYIPCWLLLYRYLRPTFLYMMRNTNKGWFGFCIIPISFTMFIYFTTKYDLGKTLSTNYILFVILSLITIFAAYAMILRLFKQTREQIALQNEQNLLKTQVTAAQVHLETLKESQEKAIIYRHDMRHHLNLINSYLLDNNLAAAKKYIADVEKTISETVIEQYCRNYAVNLILSSYIAKARNEEIKVETQIDLQEKNNISDMDLCIIFANAIENAIKACKRLEREKDRIIKIVCKTKNDQIFIQITNSCDDKVIFVNKMPINKEENHGIGTKSIAAVAQKYGGVFSFSAENGIFKTSIIVPSSM